MWAPVGLPLAMLLRRRFPLTGLPYGPMTAHAVVFAWAPAVAAFLRETHRIVPPGQERVPVDALLAEILAAG
ncbi:hypothetical protein [Streptomyces sp. NPDC001307]|uniref:hypothetical protein n=1 Tax=Streptomyces sp. NPDC001307 TaxID=3364560 RepID=UPI003680BD63